MVACYNKTKLGDSSMSGAVNRLLFAINNSNFVVQTYCVLTAYLLLIVSVSCVSYFVIPRFLYMPLALADTAMWIACGFFGWRNPIKVVLPLFSVITGLFLGLIARQHGATFAASSVITIVAFVSLSFYAYRSQRDFSFLGAVLNVCFYVSLVGCVLAIFFPIKLLTLGLSLFGVLIFVGWILYDTQQIRDNASFDYTPEHGAFDLIMDIVALRSWLQSLLEKLD